jgi:Ser/Thr protein kinase RdoA (MazF antagonist)
VVAGGLRETDHWPDVRGGLLTMLDELAAVRLEHDVALPAARTWCGGPDWPAIVEKRLVGHLPQDISDGAMAVVADVLSAEQDSAPSVVHGDFGLHNVLWQAGTASGLIDFDHLGVGDPAIDVAPLVGKFSIAELSHDFERELLRRAMFHRASLPLQVASAAELAGFASLRDHALGNFTHRSRIGILYSPAGESPAPL